MMLAASRDGAAGGVHGGRDRGDTGLHHPVGLSGVRVNSVCLASEVSGAQIYDRIMKRVAALFVLVLAVAACGTSGSEPETTTTTQPDLPTVTGVLSLSDMTFDGDLCEGAGGFDDIHTGASVVVLDGDGKTIGAAMLDQGRVVPLGPPEDGIQIVGCEFDFEADLIREASFYTIEMVGRGGPTFTHADMEAIDWFVELSLD